MAPFGPGSATPLVNVDLVGPPASRAVALPSLTLETTRSGPQLTSLSFRLPEVTIRNTPIASRLGDQHLPGGFLSSPLSAPLLMQPLRGLSVSTVGATPWNLSIGRLESGSDALLTDADAPAVAALAITLATHRRLSVAPRLLVPVSSRTAGQTSIGTAIRGGLSRHLSFVGDVGAAGTGRAGWAPLATAALVGQWAGIDAETSLLRGAGSPASEGRTTVGSIDRELARGRVHLRRGLSISGLASRSRPARAVHGPGTTLGSVGVAYDRPPYGTLAVARQRERTLSPVVVETTRVEWRPAAVNGFAVRYTERREGPPRASGTAQMSQLVEVDLPSLTPRHHGGRLSLRTALTAGPSEGRGAFRSRVRGRFDVIDHVSLAGETELELVRTDGGQVLRTLRLTSDVALLRGTALQLMYTYRAGTPLSFGQAIEARVSRTIDLFTR